MASSEGSPTDWPTFWSRRSAFRRPTALACHQPMGSTAPLDLDAVAATARPLHEARMLPAAAYLDPAVLAWEREHLFAASWACAGRADVVGPGEQSAVAVAGTSVVVSGDEAGTLHVLANVCRHRATSCCRRADAASAPCCSARTTRGRTS